MVRYSISGHTKCIIHKENRHLEKLNRRLDPFEGDVQKLEQWIIENELVTYRRMIVEMYMNAHASICYTKLKILTNGTAKFPAVYQVLESAKRHIHACYFIFKDDATGGPAIDIMKRKASEQGVKVRFMIDGFGVPHLWSRIKMKRKQIQYKTIFPVDTFKFKYWRPKYIQHRMHRKILVVDGKIGFMGGLNFSNTYAVDKKPFLNWRDTHLQMEGDGVNYLQAAFLDDFEYTIKQHVREVDYSPEHFFPDVHQDEDNTTQYTIEVDNIDAFDHVPIQIVCSGPDSHYRWAHHMFVSAFYGATSSIFISTPYFAPDSNIMMALKTACLAGVEVHLISQGKVENPFVKMTTSGFYNELMSYGVRVYQYYKAVYHSKVYIIDHKFAIVSSSNLDYRSFDGSFEISCIIYDQRVVQRLERDFWADIRECREITPEMRQQRTRIKKLPEYLLAQLAPYIKI